MPSRTSFCVRRVTPRRLVKSVEQGKAELPGHEAMLVRQRSWAARLRAPDGKVLLLVSMTMAGLTQHLLHTTVSLISGKFVVLNEVEVKR